MILEGILTTESVDGSLHVAPMGPEVNESLTSWTLKPFQTSTSYENLRRSGRCVFHVIDDSLLLAKAVLGQANNWPTRFEPTAGFILDETCHWYALRIDKWNTSQDRATASATVVLRQVERAFFGWNRAKHAVVEAAILASRIGMLDHETLIADLERLSVLVQKTAGDRERIAFELLKSFIFENTISIK